MYNKATPGAVVAHHTHSTGNLAKALKYTEDATNAVRSDRGGVAAADQVCSNCEYYTVVGSDAASGSCTLLGNRLVVGVGWCSVWVPKR